MNDTLATYGSGVYPSALTASGWSSVRRSTVEVLGQLVVPRATASNLAHVRLDLQPDDRVHAGLSMCAMVSMC